MEDSPNIDELPLVSILINNYNYGRYLSQAIDSALAQDYPQLEIIVVDDGSQDESSDVLARYSEKQIKVIFKANGGQASAFNAGFLASSGNIICFLDADDYFYETKIKHMVETFQRNHDVGWIFHELAYVDSDCNHLSIDRHNRLQTSERVDFRQIFYAGRRFSHSIPCGLCFRRAVLSKILPMPESSGVTISDNYIKYAALGLSPGIFLADRLAVQRIHDSNIYTFRADALALRAEINIKTGFYLRQNFPDISLFADKVFSRGCGAMLAQRGISDVLSVPEVKSYFNRYANLPFMIINLPKILLQGLRFYLTKNRKSYTSFVNTPSDRS